MAIKKRERLEVIKDILKIIKDNNKIKSTPLLRQSNLSSSRFQEYFKELLEKQFVKQTNYDKDKFISLTDKGYKFLEKYKTILGFIEEFEL